MIPCPSCGAGSPPAHKFCQSCGRPLGSATVALSASQMAHGPKRQAFDVAGLFAGKERLVAGRAADCDIRLDHPSVSRYHARFERRGGVLHVSDLGSINGIWLGGKRVAEPAALRDGDKLGIGPYLLTIAAGKLQSLDSSRSLRLEAHHLEKIVAVPDGTRKLLDDVSLVVAPGEFVALLGPSGSGKSTLMDCLNGRRRATGGLVLANGENFYRHFDSFRQSLGYVPQKDIVHNELTVERALLYTARLRLPMDSDPAELHARLEDVLRQMELLPHRGTPVGQLSGGQIKRVSLGAELLGQPALLYIDEATSGLDAGTERRMMRLFRDLADEGRSLVCITHNVDNVDRCHLALILARGRLLYYGPPKEAAAWFKVPRLGDVYDRIAERPPEDWEKDFRHSDLFRHFIADRLAQPPASGPARPAPVAETTGPGSPSPAASEAGHAERFRWLTAGMLKLRERLRPLREAWHQFRTLTARYVEMILGDPRSLRLVLLQAPLVALFLLLGFVGKPFDSPMPLLRPLEDKEREALLVLRGLGDLLDAKKPLTEEQEAALRKVNAEAMGVRMPVDGLSVAVLLRAVQAGKETPAQRAFMERTKIELEVDGTAVTASLADAADAWRKAQGSDLPRKLLRIAGPVVPTRDWHDPRYAYILLFVLSVVVIWFGCNNASREIVKEEAIYARERSVNLRVAPYLASKFLVMSGITTLQVALLLLFVWLPLELLSWWVPGHTVPPAALVAGYPAQFLVFSVLGMTGVALGLLLSACVSSPDRANALLPYVLIPQMILGGGFIAATGPLFWVAAVGAPVYWAYRATHLGANVLPKGFPGHASYGDGMALPLLALVTQAAVLLLLTYVALRRKDA